MHKQDASNLQSALQKKKKKVTHRFFDVESVRILDVDSALSSEHTLTEQLIMGFLNQTSF